MNCDFHFRFVIAADSLILYSNRLNKVYYRFNFSYRRLSDFLSTVINIL